MNTAAVPLQGGLTNPELSAAWDKKLPGVIPTDRDLTAFALGIEVGQANARDLERQDWSRVHHVLAKHGVHPGRTDDHLADVIDAALSDLTPKALDHNMSPEVLAAMKRLSDGLPKVGELEYLFSTVTTADLRTVLAALSAPQDERAAFEAHFPHFDFAKVKDGWGRDQYAHPHIESTWFGWQARASLDPTPQPEPEPMIDGWPLYSMLPPPASKQGEVPMPPLDIQRSLGLDAVRYVAGWPESYVKEYARAYGDARAKAEREWCADEADCWIGFDKTASKACEEIAAAIRSHGPDARAAAVREPLSDEQIAFCIYEARMESGTFKRDGTMSFRIARAIERAHGIGITAQAQQEGK